MDNKARIVVVGAGTAGLAAAHTLLKDRDEVAVTVLEAADYAGGRMGGEEVDGFYIDRAASLFIDSYATVRSIARDLDIPLKPSPHTKGGYVYNNGRFYSVFVGGTLGERLRTARTLLSFRLLSPKGILQFRRFSKLARSHRDDLDINDHTKLLRLDGSESFQDFMEANSMGEYVQQWATNDVRAFTGGGPEQSGAASMMALLWNFTLNPAERVSIPETGVGSFATELAQACSAHLKLSTPVRRVHIDNGAVTGVTTVGGEFFSADAVICCTTAPVASRLMPDLPPEITEVLQNVKYSTFCKVVLGLDFDLLPPEMYAAVFPRGAGTPIVALENAKAVAPKSVPAGKSMLNCVVVEDDAREMFALSDGEIIDRIIDEIRRFFPDMPRTPAMARVYRWHEGGCLIHGGLLTQAHEMRQQSLPKIRGLFLAGDYMHLPLTNGAMRSGVDAAQACRSYLST